MDKVSVVIPSYNSSSYILNAIQSVLNQTYDNLEVIVADDASTDDTREVVQNIGDPRVKLIERRVNGGAAAARNSAIRSATGRYIAFLDSDDCWLPNKLSVQIDKMQEEAASFSCTRFIIKGTSIYSANDIMSVADFNSMTQTVEMADWDHQTVRAVDYVIGACQMIRRRALQEVGLFDEHIFYGPEDIDMCLRLRQAGWQVVYHPEAVVVHNERRLTQSLRSGLTWKHLWGLGYFFRKHGYLLSRRRLYAQLPEVMRRSGPEVAN